MRKTLTALVCGLAMPAAAFAAGTPNGSGSLPGCGPSNQTPKKCNPPPAPVPGPPGPQGPTGPQGPAGPSGSSTTVTVVPGPGANQITVTVNGVSTVVTIPTSPVAKPCVNTRKAALLGPLPRQFKPGMRVTITSNGHTQTSRVIADRKVPVNLSKLPCGVYPLVIRHPGITPALRIWSLTGGNTLKRFWFPGIPHVSNH